MISTKIHGYIDYLMGLFLILLPFIITLPEGAATLLPIILGVGTVIYSLITDYELGMASILGMKAHLGLDVVAGLFLAASPWIFGFSEIIYLPFLALGVAEVLIAIMTDKERRNPII